MTQLKNPISATVARARVRADVASYFRELGGHGQVVADEIAEGEMDAFDHAEAILDAAEKRSLVDLSARHDLDAVALRDALEHECAEIIAWAISEVEAAEAMTSALTDAARIMLINEVRAMTAHALTASIDLLEMALASADGDGIAAIEERLSIYESELSARAAVP